MDTVRVMRNGRLLIIAACWLMSSWNYANSGADHAISVEPCARIELPHGRASSLMARDGFVYIINSWTRGNGLLVIDATDPSAPKYIGGVPTIGYPQSFQIEGGFIWLPTGHSLSVIDVHIPGKAKLVRDMLIDWWTESVKGVHVSGERAYLACGKAGLRVMDITEPGAPLLTACYPKTGDLTQLVSKGDYIFFPAEKKLKVAQVGGDSLCEVAQCEVGDVNELYIAENKLLAVTGNRSLCIFDISNPKNPVLLSELPQILGKGNVAGNKACLLMEGERIGIIDISHPSKPVIEREFPVPAGSAFVRVFLERDTLYTLDSKFGGLRMMHIAPSQLTLLGSLPICSGEGFEALEVVGDCVLAGTTENVLWLADTRNCREPIAPTYYRTDTPFSDFERVGDYLLVGDGLLQIKDPLHPVAACEIKCPASLIRVKGKYAYIIVQGNLTIRDISKLPAMTVLGSYKPEGRTSSVIDVEIGDHYAYVLTRNRPGDWWTYGGDQVEVLNIQDPANPVPLGSCEVYNSRSCALRGNYLYLFPNLYNAPEKILTIVDVSTPESPRVSKRIEGLIERGSDSARSLSRGDYLYFADYGVGIKVLDVSSALEPKLVALYAGENLTYTGFDIDQSVLYGRSFSGIDTWKIRE